LFLIEMKKSNKGMISNKKFIESDFETIESKLFPFSDNIYETIDDSNLIGLYNDFDAYDWSNFDKKINLFWEKVRLYISNNSTEINWSICLELKSNKNKWFRFDYSGALSSINVIHRDMKNISLSWTRTFGILESFLPLLKKKRWWKFNYLYMKLSQSDVARFWTKNWFFIDEWPKWNPWRDRFKFPEKYKILKWTEINQLVWNNVYLQSDLENYIVKKSTWEVIRFVMRKDV